MTLLTEERENTTFLCRRDNTYWNFGTSDSTRWMTRSRSTSLREQRSTCHRSLCSQTTFCQSDLRFHSALIIQFIFWITMLAWKASYWHTHNKHSQRSSSAHYRSTEPAGLQCNAEQITCVCACVCVLRIHPCARLLSLILGSYQLPIGLSKNVSRIKNRWTQFD